MADKYQINLENDTANFRAQQSALTLSQTHRPKNTARSYDRHTKEWREWCERLQYDDGDLVHESKLVRFLTEEIINRPVNSRKKRKLEDTDLLVPEMEEDPDAEVKTLKFQTVRGYKTAILNFYHYQHSRGLNRHPSPNGAALQSLFKVQRSQQHEKAKRHHEDRGKGTIADGYDTRELQRITEAAWRHSEAAKGSSAGAFLRTNLDFLLGHFLLLRGESRRMAELADLQLLMLENEGPTPAPCLLYIMSNGKTNQNGRIEYAGLLRHRDVDLCCMSAMANYFVWRWEQSGEKFPSFGSNKDWYDIQVLIGAIKDAEKEISDSTQRQWIHKLYKALAIKISKITHAGRGSGAKEAEKLDIDWEQICRQGKWANDSMHKGYLTGLPRAFMRGMAGFMAEHAGAYFIARSQVQPPNELLQMIFPKLDYWIQQKSDDIATKHFLNLLAYLRVVFLQDSVLLRPKYPEHCLWNLDVFKHPLYASFAADVIASLDDKDRDMDSQIRTAIPILGQQVMNLDASLSIKMAEGFKNQHQQAMRMEGKLNDFLEGKIAFTMTPVKRQKLLQFGATSDETTEEESIPIDPRLLPSSAFAKSASLCFVSPSKKTSARSQSKAKVGASSAAPPPVYRLSRNVNTVVDLFKEWTQGLGTGPSVQAMNEHYGDTWRKGWSGADREFYSVRNRIITYIYEQAEGASAEAMAWELEAERASKKMSINMLGKRIRKGLE